MAQAIAPEVTQMISIWCFLRSSATCCIQVRKSKGPPSHTILLPALTTHLLSLGIGMIEQQTLNRGQVAGVTFEPANLFLSLSNQKMLQEPQKCPFSSSLDVLIVFCEWPQ